jgi:hypothetical protein
VRAWISSSIAASHSGDLVALLNHFGSFITNSDDNKREEGI